MNPYQQAFVEALKAWDATAMAVAATGAIESLESFTATTGTRNRIRRACREFLDDLARSPLAMAFGELPQSGGLSLVLHTMPVPRQPPYESIRLMFSPAANDGPRMRRWAELGFPTYVNIPRDQIRTPRPYEGEPGHLPEPPATLDEPAPRPAARHHTYAHALAAPGGPTPFLDRYLARDTAGVWADLVKLRDNVRADDVLHDAVAVARETMTRCRRNLETLQTRLLDAGWQFNNPAGALVPPAADALARIAEWESRVGPLPLSLCAFVEIVGAVNFTGRLPAFADHDGEPYPDPLVVDPVEHLLAYDPEQWLTRRTYSIDFAPDAYHKEDVSGGPPYAIHVPSAAADVRVRAEWQRTTFVDYLRRSIIAGGLPGWRRRETPTVVRRWVEGLGAGLTPI